MAAKPDSEQVRARAAADEDGIRQYSLAEIILIWAAAALPMALIAWVVAPHFGSDIPGQGLVKPLVLGLGCGLIWQLVLVLILVYREQSSLKFEKVRKTLWLTQPRDPRSGRVGEWIWLWLIPLLLGFGLEQLIPISPCRSTVI